MFAIIPCTKEIYYSIGTSGNKNTITPSITITSGTATLGAAENGNVGVGDKITFSGGTQSAVYISAVNSQTSFDVILVDGSTPVNDSGTVTTITRTFTSVVTAVDEQTSGSGAANLLGDNDLTATGAGVQLNLVCYKDAVLQEGYVLIDGWTTDSTYFITLTAAAASQVASGVSQRHTGVAGSGVVIESTGGAGGNFRDDYTVVEWLEWDGAMNLLRDNKTSWGR